MSKRLTRFMFTAVALLGLAAPLHAQSRRVVSSSELDAAVSTRPGNREAVRQFLATDQVQQMAARMGVSTSELSARVATLDQESLDAIAARTGVGDRTLAGGSETIVISTTVVIIALLIIILLVK
ncbi:MAG TPA: PA2779 family protein [Gemmatimonadales bacterium]